MLSVSLPGIWVIIADKVASGVELDEPAAAGVAVGVAVASFDDDVQPHVPTTNAAKMVTHTANVNGFIFSPPDKQNKYVK
jgi:hypothetical protein